MIPIYNAPLRYLEAALKSVLVQDPGQLEMQIQLVDDCSPRPIPDELIKKWSDGRAQVHRNPKNLGLAGTWNECVRLARGHFVHILHQDDLVLPGFYEKLRSGLETCPSVGAAFCRHAFIDEEGNQTGSSDLEQSMSGVLQDFQAKLTQKAIIQCPAVVVRKSVYDQVGGFNANLAYVLDWDMWFRIGLIAQIWYEPALLACYRIHNAAATSGLQRTGSDVREIGEFLRVAESYFPRRQGRRLTAVGRSIYAKRAVNHANTFLRFNDNFAAANQIREAWRLHKSPVLVAGTLEYGVKLLLGRLGLRQLFNILRR